MRPLIILAPASFLFVLYLASAEPYSETIARVQMEADSIAARLTEASSNLSSFGSLDPAAAEESRLARMKVRELQSQLRRTWLRLDELKLKATMAERGRAAVRALATVLAILGFGTIASKDPKNRGLCLLCIGMLVASSGVSL